MTCCTQSKILYLAAQRFNLTLEYVDSTDFIETQELQNMTATRIISRMISEEMVDVIGMATNAWLPLTTTKDTSESDLQNLEFSVPIWEGYEIAIVVPKKAVSKSPFIFFEVLPPLCWMLLLAFLLIYSTIEWFLTRKKRIYRVGVLSKIAFRYYQMTLFQGVSAKTQLAVFWSFAVSFLTIEFLKDQLLTLLTTQPLFWPETLGDLYRQKSKFTFVSSNVAFMKESDVFELKEIAKIAIFQDISEPVATFEYLAGGSSAFLARSVEIDTLSETLSPTRFALLDDKFRISQYPFYVSKKFKFYHNFMKM